MIAALVLAAQLTANEFARLPLSAALQQAVALSPDVAAARERVNENQALLAAARGSASPSAFANYAQAPQGGNAGNTIAQRLMTVGGQMTLGDYLGLAPLVRQASFVLEQTQFDLLAAQRAERVKAAGEYYAALKAAADVNLREQNVQGALSDLRAAQIRYRAGDAPHLDVVRAQVALAGAQADLDSARADRANAWDALAIETGTPVQALAALQPSMIAPPAMLAQDKAVARALAARSDLFSAARSVEGERAALDLAQRAELPSLSLSAGYTTGVDSGIWVHGPSANINLNVPVSHAAGDRAQAERARLAAASYRMEAIRRQIVLDVTAAVRTLQADARAAVAAARALSASREELRATQIGYRNGASSSLDVADARRTYIQAALNELDAVYAQAQAQALLELEMGP